MNVSIYLDDRTAMALKRAAARAGRTRNSIVAEAVKAWLADAERKDWPKELLEWEGDSELVPFERHRPRAAARARFP